MKTKAFTDILDNLRSQLQIKKQLLQAEISSYPPPIPACDAQFNYLLELRSNLFRDLGRLDKLSSEDMSSDEIYHLLDEFIASSAFLDEATQERMHSQLKDYFPEMS